jgi:TonB-dependent SusC/RagA subfamily outer membrane receptor
MKLKLLSVLLLTGAVLFVGFKTQEDKLKELLDRFEEINQKAYQEKIYLHTDKPYYAIGDEIWFKAYLLNAKNLLPSSKSSLMIVELINTNNKLYKRIKIPLVAGTGWGNFNLADSLKEGNYRIRAYTNWMRNFDEDFYYDHTFKVGDIRSSQLIVKATYQYDKSGSDDVVTANLNYSNIGGTPYSNKEVVYSVELAGKPTAKGKATTDAKGDVTLTFKNSRPETQQAGILNTSLYISERTVVNKIIPIANTSNDITLQFFPEGGDLINSIRSKVAFKALGKDGLGKAVSGVLKNEKGESVAKIATRHKGMGTFSFTPLPGGTYVASLTFEDGSSRDYPLQKAKEEGLALSVANTGKDSVVVRVLGNMSAANANGEYTVLVQSSGNLLYSVKSRLSASNGGFLIKLPKSTFPAGISQFTLINDAMQPLAERLVFINNTNSFLDLQVSSDKQAYRKRDKVNLTVNTGLSDKKSGIGSFSVSVIDENKVPVNENEEHTIFSELLVNSDLKGHIEEPNYYFHQVDEKKVEDLDVLLLTQGWRRFKWQNVINNVQPNFIYKPEKTLALRGRVTNNKKPVPNADLLIFTSKAGGIIQVKANANGEFNLDSLVFPDSTKFVIQARSEKGRKFVEIEMEDGFSDQIPAQHQSTLNANINSSMIAYLKNSKTQYEELLKYGLASRTIMLDEVKIVEQKKRQLENSNNLNGAGNADRVVTAEELQNAPTLEFALQGKVAGLIFQNGEAYFTRNMGTPAQIILDGMYVEPDMLNSITPQDVESVEILKNISYTAIYGSRGSGGVIVINTKRGGGGGFSNTYSPGIIAYTALGFSNAKEFYVPAYDKPEMNNNMADLRTTIYWNPAVITDSTGTAKVNFFNADGAGSYRVVVEGIDMEGHIGRKVMRYQVN